MDDVSHLSPSPSLLRAERLFDAGDYAVAQLAFAEAVATTADPGERAASTQRLAALGVDWLAVALGVLTLAISLCVGILARVFGP